MRSVFSGTRNERGTHSLHGLLGPDSNPVRKRQVVKHATGCLTPMAISSHWLSQTESSSSSARTLSRARPKPGTTVVNLEQLRHVDSRFLVSDSGHAQRILSRLRWETRLVYRQLRMLYRKWRSFQLRSHRDRTAVCIITTNATDVLVTHRTSRPRPDAKHNCSFLHLALAKVHHTSPINLIVLFYLLHELTHTC